MFITTFNRFRIQRRTLTRLRPLPVIFKPFLTFLYTFSNIFAIFLCFNPFSLFLVLYNVFRRVFYYCRPPPPPVNHSRGPPLILEPLHPSTASTPIHSLHIHPFSHFQDLPRVFTLFRLLSTVLESYYIPRHVYELSQPFSRPIIHFQAYTFISELLPPFQAILSHPQPLPRFPARFQYLSTTF